MDMDDNQAKEARSAGEEVPTHVASSTSTSLHEAQSEGSPGLTRRTSHNPNTPTRLSALFDQDSPGQKTFTPNRFQMDRLLPQTPQNQPTRGRESGGIILGDFAAQDDYALIQQSTNKLADIRPKEGVYCVALRTIVLFVSTLLILFIGFSLYNVSLVQHFCDTDQDGTSTIHTGCQDCPRNGYCATGKLMACEEGYITNGVHCVANSVNTQNQEAILKTMHNLLVNRYCYSVSRTCAADDDIDGYLLLKDFKNAVWSELRDDSLQGVTYSEYSDIWLSLYDKVQDTPQLYGIVLEDIEGSVYAKLDPLTQGEVDRPLRCSMASFFCWFPPLVLVVVFVVEGIYSYNAAQQNNANTEKAIANALLADVRECLAQRKWITFAPLLLKAALQDKYQAFHLSQFDLLWDNVMQQLEKDRTLSMTTDGVTCKARLSTQCLTRTPGTPRRSDAGEGRLTPAVGTPVNTRHMFATPSPISPTKMTMH